MPADAAPLTQVPHRGMTPGSILRRYERPCAERRLSGAAPLIALQSRSLEPMLST